MSKSALLDIVSAIIDVLQTTALLQPYVDGKMTVKKISADIDQLGKKRITTNFTTARWS